MFVFGVIILQIQTCKFTRILYWRPNVGVDISETKGVLVGENIFSRRYLYFHWGILPGIHTWHSTRISCKSCSFGSDRMISAFGCYSVFNKGKFLEIQASLSSNIRYKRRKFDYDRYTVMGALLEQQCTSTAEYRLPRIGVSRKLISGNTSPFASRDVRIFLDGLIIKYALLQESCTFSAQSRLPTEKFSSKFTPGCPFTFAKRLFFSFFFFFFFFFPHSVSNQEHVK